MCGRFTLTTSVQRLAEQSELTGELAKISLKRL